MEVRKGHEDKTDDSLGMHIVKTFGYGDVLWKNSDREESSGGEFEGNFSVITPAGKSIRLGIYHSSHCCWTGGDTCHVGSVTLVEIPDQCLVIFHGILFHYGDRAQFDACQFIPSLRLFNYLRSESIHNLGHETTTCLAEPSLWCDYSCEQCNLIHDKLKKKRCKGKDEMVWSCDLSPSEIFTMKPGAHVMGSLNSLGWAVVKSFTYGDKMVDYNNEVISVCNHFIDHRVDKDPNQRWHNIQGQEEKTHFSLKINPQISQ